MRSRGSNIAGNPVLIGAATILVVFVAVFLSYNANQGLPFVPTYSINAEVPSAANLVRGNEIRIGGARVGAIDKIVPKRTESGRNVALLTMKLEKAAAPLPKDSTLIIRPKSLLGLKYVELRRGTSSQGFDDGDTMPISSSQPAQVEFDEFTDTFDPRTREASRENLIGFGDAFAGRGSSLNLAIGELRPLLRDIIPVARNLSDPKTHLVRLVRELGQTAAIVAPVAEIQAELFVNLDTTIRALNQVARPFIQDSISEGPATLDNAVRNFRALRPFLANLEGFMGELRPGVRSLVDATPDLADALQFGTPTLRRSVKLSARLEPTLRSLARFAQDPLVSPAVRRLTGTVADLEPILTFVAPTQTVCNYAADWFRNVSDLLSEGDASGTWQRFIIVATPQGPNNEGGPSSAPANGPTVENHLHTNPYPNTAAPGQPRECEAANEPYIAGQTVIGNVPGTQPATTDLKP